METNQKSILDTYLDHNGLVLKSKSKIRDGMSFMPILLVDAMNIIYMEYIAPLDIKHKEKQIRSRWHDAYRYFMNEFFLPFDDNQKCEICDLMDSFESYIHNEIEVFRVTVMSRFMQYDTNVRLVLSAILACNVLAQSSQILWKAQRLKKNAYIASIEEWSYKFLNEYANKRINRESKLQNLNDYEPLRIATQKICNSVIEFAKQCEL